MNTPVTTLNAADIADHATQASMLRDAKIEVLKRTWQVEGREKPYPYHPIDLVTNVPTLTNPQTIKNALERIGISAEIGQDRRITVRFRNIPVAERELFELENSASRGAKITLLQANWEEGRDSYSIFPHGSQRRHLPEALRTLEINFQEINGAIKISKSSIADKFKTLFTATSQAERIGQTI